MFCRSLGLLRGFTELRNLSVVQEAFSRLCGYSTSRSAQALRASSGPSRLRLLTQGEHADKAWRPSSGCCCSLSRIWRSGFGLRALGVLVSGGLANRVYLRRSPTVKLDNLYLEPELAFQVFQWYLPPLAEAVNTNNS